MKVSSKENYSLQKNNIAYPSEKSKLFLKINKKIECIYKIAEMMHTFGAGRRTGAADG